MVAIPKDNKLAVIGFVILLIILAILGPPFVFGFLIVLLLASCLMWASFPLIIIVLTILIIVFVIIPLITDFKTTIQNSFQKFKHKQAKLDGKLLTVTINDDNYVSPIADTVPI